MTFLNDEKQETEKIEVEADVENDAVADSEKTSEEANNADEEAVEKSTEDIPPAKLEIEVAVDDAVEKEVEELKAAAGAAKEEEIVLDAEDKKKLFEEEVAAAVDEELGVDWLATKPFHVRFAVQFARIFAAFVALWFFLCSLELLGKSFQALSGKSAGGLFSGQENPIIGLIVGILATVLVQSSSTTTSIIVVLVASDLVPLPTAIPMVMGANIGTSITNTIVSLGFADDGPAYSRAFGGATVHDMFNFLNVLVFLPLELIVNAINNNNGGLLQIVSEKLADIRGEGSLDGGDAFSAANPIKKITEPLIKAMIDINKDVITDHANPPSEVFADGCPTPDAVYKFKDKKTVVDFEGFCEEQTCTVCVDNVINQDVLAAVEEAFDNQRLIKGGAFVDSGDETGGIIVLVLSLVILILSLAIIVRVLTAIVKGGAKKVLVKALNYDFIGGGYLAIAIGCGLTFIVQSSSITTSILTPLVAVDALSLESMFPFTLGANIGTTGTGLIAAATTGERNGFAIALVHLFFNVFGTLLWYPTPFMRKFPLGAARNLGKAAGLWKVIPLVYILCAFLLYPLIFLGISEGFQIASTGGIVGGSIGLLTFVALHGYAFFWYHKREGKHKFVQFVEKRKAKLAAKKAQEKLAEEVGAGADGVEPESV